MLITIAELEKNLSHYLVLSSTEDIYISQNGKIISKLSNPHMKKVEILKRLEGIISITNEDIDYKDGRLQRQ